MGRLQISILVLALLAGLLPAQCSKASAEATPAATRMAQSWEGTEHAVGALDDLANPYRGQYSSYDRWLDEHYLVLTDDIKDVAFTGPKGDAARAKFPKDWVFTTGLVDENGWLIPRSLQSTDSEQQFQTISDLFSKPPGFSPPSIKSAYFFTAAGLQDQAVRDQEQLDYWSPRADRYPPVPAWLGEHPPLQTVFVPNGEILCYGELGLSIEPQPGRYDMGAPPGEYWYRYDQQGRLLGRHDQMMRAPSRDWTEIYSPGRRETAANENPGFHSFFSSHAYLAVSKGSFVFMSGERQATEKDQPVAIYDFDGSRVEAGDLLQDSHRYGVQPLSAENIRGIYLAQLHSGRSSAESTSPYEGTAEGPVRAEGVVRKAKKVAFGQEGMNDIGIFVGAMDDPANPYSRVYNEADNWLYEHQGEGYARSAANAIDPLDKHITSLSAKVDSSGWLMPLEQSCQWLDRIMPPGDLRQRQEFDNATPGLWWEGELDEAAWTAWCQTAWKRGVAMMPPVPDWLATQYVEAAVFLPDGNILIQGEPLDPAAVPQEKLHSVWPSSTKEWLLYSAAGSLVRATGNHDNYYWQLSFDPDFEQRLKAAGPQGLECVVNSGYLTLRRETDGQPSAAFDYSGAPLEATLPLSRQPGVCVMLSWLDLRGIYRIQQTMKGTAQ